MVNLAGSWAIQMQVMKDLQVGKENQNRVAVVRSRDLSLSSPMNRRIEAAGRRISDLIVNCLNLNFSLTLANVRKPSG